MTAVTEGLPDAVLVADFLPEARALAAAAEALLDEALGTPRPEPPFGARSGGFTPRGAAVRAFDDPPRGP